MSRETTATPERDVAHDLVLRGLLASPLFLLVGLIGWGLPGLLSVAVALAVVLANFAFSAWLVTTGSHISLTFMMGAALFGYILRIGLVLLVFIAIRDTSWCRRLPFGFTLIVAHLGLLIWETRHISASLAFPGLKPTRTTS